MQNLSAKMCYQSYNFLRDYNLSDLFPNEFVNHSFLLQDLITYVLISVLRYLFMRYLAVYCYFLLIFLCDGGFFKYQFIKKKKCSAPLIAVLKSKFNDVKVTMRSYPLCKCFYSSILTFFATPY